MSIDRFADELRDDPQPEAATAIALEAGSEDTMALPQDADATLLIHDDDPRQVVISVDTRDAVYAAYVDKWKRRIEAVGDQYFTELGEFEELTGSPILRVKIQASGALSEVIVRKSSGSNVVDQAALDILRRASPFDPFSDEIAEDYDVLVFTYKFVFSDSNLASASIN